MTDSSIKIYGRQLLRCGSRFSCRLPRGAAAPYYCRRKCSSQRIYGACAVAKRLECVELAPAFNDARRSRAGASSTHSPALPDFARLGCGLAALCLSLLWRPAFALAGEQVIRENQTG